MICFQDQQPALEAALKPGGSRGQDWKKASHVALIHFEQSFAAVVVIQLQADSQRGRRFKACGRAGKWHEVHHHRSAERLGARAQIEHLDEHK